MRRIFRRWDLPFSRRKTEQSFEERDREEDVGGADKALNLIRNEFDRIRDARIEIITVQQAIHVATEHEPKLYLEQMQPSKVTKMVLYLYFAVFLSYVYTIIYAIIISDVANILALCVLGESRADCASGKIWTLLILEGIFRSVAAFLVFFLLIAYPQRVIVNSYRTLSYPLPEQVVVISMIIVLNLAPSFSFINVIYYWYHLSDSWVSFNDGERIALFRLFVFQENFSSELVDYNSVTSSVVLMMQLACTGVIIKLHGKQEQHQESAALAATTRTNDCASKEEIKETLTAKSTQFYSAAALEESRATDANETSGVAGMKTELSCCQWLCSECGRRSFQFVRAGFSVPFGSLIVLYLFSIWTLCGVFDYSSSIVPLVGFITVVRVCAVYDEEVCAENNGNDGFARAVSSSYFVVLELLILYGIQYNISRTRRFLKKLPYATARAKHLGFNFFKTVSITMWVHTILCSVVTVSVPPVELWLFTIARNDSVPEGHNDSYIITTDPLLYTGVSSNSMGFGAAYLMISMWLFTLGFAYLPCDSEGFKGWFVSVEVDKEERLAAFDVTDERPTYLAEEKDVETSLATQPQEKFHSTASGWPIERQLHARLFVMESELLLYFFTHIVYDIPSFNSEQPMSFEQKALLIDDPRYQLAAHIENVETHTQVIVAASEDRIVVAFRGTVSAVNMKTDFDGKLVPHPAMQQVAPMLLSNDPLGNAEAKKPALVHHGFLKAYRSVQRSIELTVARLLSHPSRPKVICCTGHSLGAGLAAICTTELATAYPRLSVCYTSFGAPKIGNFSYASRFRRLVPCCRRFVLCSDIIPRMPPESWFSKFTRQGYYHLGMEILLDQAGNLLLEPSFVERYMLHGMKRYSTLNHMRSSYSLSLMLWCIRGHYGQWHPNWWLSIVNNVNKYGMKRILQMDRDLQMLMLQNLQRDGIEIAIGKKLYRHCGVQVGSSDVAQLSHVALDTASFLGGLWGAAAEEEDPSVELAEMASDSTFRSAESEALDVDLAVV